MDAAHTSGKVFVCFLVDFKFSFSTVLWVLINFCTEPGQCIFHMNGQVVYYYIRWGALNLAMSERVSRIVVVLAGISK